MRRSWQTRRPAQGLNAGRSLPLIITSPCKIKPQGEAEAVGAGRRWREEKMRVVLKEEEGSESRRKHRNKMNQWVKRKCKTSWEDRERGGVREERGRGSDGVGREARRSMARARRGVGGGGSQKGVREKGRCADDILWCCRTPHPPWNTDCQQYLACFWRNEMFVF